MKSVELLAAGFLMVLLALLVFCLGMLNAAPIAGLVGMLFLIGGAAKVVEVGERTFLQEQEALRNYKGSSL